MKTFISLLLTTLLLTMGQPAFAQSRQILSFVQQVYIEGVPYDRVKKLNPDSALPELLNLLGDTKHIKSWPNIVVTLGMLGDERAVEPLISFLNRDMSGRRLSHSHYIAKSSVVMALGYIVNESKNKRALDFLIESATPEAWKQKSITWRSPYHRDEADLHKQLATMSVLGLGLSGDPSAAEKLKSMQEPRNNRRRRNLKDRSNRIDVSIINEALKANNMISERGIIQYNRKSKSN